jgi:hypothetical protein
MESKTEVRVVREVFPASSSGREYYFVIEPGEFPNVVDISYCEQDSKKQTLSFCADDIPLIAGSLMHAAREAKNGTMETH